MSAQNRGATQDYSRGLAGRRAAPLLLLSAILGAGLLIGADLSTLYEVRVLTVTRTSVSGHAQHGWALALIGLAAVPLAAAATRNRRAMAGLAVLGAAALAVAAVAGDFHDVHSTGQIGRLYENATAQPQRGFYLETLGAILLVAGGLGALLAARGGAGGRPRRARPGAEEAAAGPGEAPPGTPRRARPGAEAAAAGPGEAPAGPGREERVGAPARAPRRRPPTPPRPEPEPDSRPDPDDWFA